MDARVWRVAFGVAFVCGWLATGLSSAQAAMARSRHFLVTAPTNELAQEIADAAEAYRRDLAIEWLGAELPPWPDICPINAQVSPQLGAGGATSFMFAGGQPRKWQMSVQGTRERVLDSVLPHEITHTIFASHFGQPLPRWADEGGCTTVEHDSEIAKHRQFLIEFLHTERGIPFNRMFTMKEYPRDILPLYAQGHSVASFLIEQGGKRKYIEFIGMGLKGNRWPEAVQRMYGFDDLSDLQLCWVEWVRQGQPPVENFDNERYLAAAERIAAPGAAPIRLTSARRRDEVAPGDAIDPEGREFSRPRSKSDPFAAPRRMRPSSRNLAPIEDDAPRTAAVENPLRNAGGESWYAQARRNRRAAERDGERDYAREEESVPRDRVAARPQPPRRVEPTVLQSRRGGEEFNAPLDDQVRPSGYEGPPRDRFDEIAREDRVGPRNRARRVPIEESSVPREGELFDAPPRSRTIWR